RYGVAYNAEIFAGKVLSDRGSGADGGIIQGIEWALENGCAVISMSLGATVQPGEPFSQIYETVAQRALAQGTLIIAAAGNSSSDRFGKRLNPPNPVGRPANSPSIMAVAAIDSELQIASFSDGSINPDGGQVDIAGPGVAVYSTWTLNPLPTWPWEPPNPPARYNTISGTSMATPHVAGIAALYAEATGKRGLELWALLMRDAQRLSLSSADAGAGLVQAPK
nr:S8 family serine peptidase [Leptolyngbyaceae cyanobacterium MAG.088]